uniref:Metalloendopeptidase n=1 Tax=Isarachnanthus nocturnus TaxID=1240238 RepID=A0A7G7WYS4_9CNID|nr:toxin candidate TRINITY_DN19458_c0_g1_i1 [Isarachnanthus nocturnus]
MAALKVVPLLLLLHCSGNLGLTEDLGKARSALYQRLLAYRRQQILEREFQERSVVEPGMTRQEYQEEIEAEEEHAEFVEGDIIPDPEILALEQGKIKRDTLALQNRLWPGGIVPYVFESSMTTKGAQAVREAIEEYRKQTCVQFIPKRPEDSHFVRFFRGRGCYSKLGRAPEPGGQPLSVGPHCEWKGTMMHEMMHSIGFFHEQSRTDRDNFVKILFENVKQGQEKNFKKYGHGLMDYLGAPYDYGSIMHYPRNAFSRNGRDTLIPMKGGVEVGQRKGFSVIDVQQIKDLYCKPPPTPRPPPTVPCVDLGRKCQVWKSKGRCEMDNHMPKMMERCAKTCGHC